MNFCTKNSFWASIAAGLCTAASFGTSVLAADIIYEEPKIDMIDPTPVALQRPAVDGINFKLSAVSGVIGGYKNHMFIASVATPVPFFSSLGIQLDLGIGQYRQDYTSAASGLHIFWRNPDTGLLGIYGDWGFVDNEHGGRVGIEASAYNGRWSLDTLLAVQFGQHLLTKIVDEVDVSYYFTDNLRGSLGHRLTSRGHAANVSFEYMPDNIAGWSIYGEAEAGEDDYQGAWAGVRYSFGQSSANSLIERDRTADPISRIPRNLASFTQCAELPVAIPEDWWHSETSNLCASKSEINDHNGIIGKKNSP